MRRDTGSGLTRLELLRPDSGWSAVLMALSDDALRELERLLTAIEAGDLAEAIRRCEALLSKT